MNRTSLLRKISALALTFGIGIGAAVATAAPASAWTGATGGQTGGATLPTIYVGDLVMPSGYRAFTLYGNAATTAYRVPGSTGAQTITARYFAQKWDGSSWVAVTSSPTMTGTMTASQTSVNFSAPYLQPTVARGFFRVTTLLQWYNGAGTLIGGTIVTGNSTTDHVCVTPVRACRSYAGYVQTGLDKYTW